jgi:hypothetical protein
MQYALLTEHQLRRVGKPIPQHSFIVGPANQGGCIIRCVGSLADEKF